MRTHPLLHLVIRGCLQRGDDFLVLHDEEAGDGPNTTETRCIVVLVHITFEPVYIWEGGFEGW